MSVVNSFSQVYTINMSNAYGFEHPSTITTDMAMKNNGMVYTGGGTTEAKYIVNLNTMKVFYSDWKNTVGDMTITKVNNTNAILNIVFITKDGRIASMVVDESVNPQSGVMIFVRYNETSNGITKTVGWFSKNVNIIKE